MTLKKAIEMAVEEWWQGWHRFAEPDDDMPEWVAILCDHLMEDFNLANGKWIRRRKT